VALISFQPVESDGGLDCVAAVLGVHHLSPTVRILLRSEGGRRVAEYPRKLTSGNTRRLRLRRWFVAWRVCGYVEEVFGGQQTLCQRPGVVRAPAVEGLSSDCRLAWRLWCAASLCTTDVFQGTTRLCAFALDANDCVCPGSLGGASVATNWCRRGESHLCDLEPKYIGSAGECVGGLRACRDSGGVSGDAVTQ